jgi:hypothetical protein
MGGNMKRIFTKADLTGATAIVVYLMAANFLLHLLLPDRQYGLFFDEYYYYSMSEHLAFGYLDAPPVTGGLMALSRVLLGDSIPAMHVFPALAGSFAMLFAALTARKMGGGRFAQTLTATAVMLAPMFMTFSGMFTYDAFDQLMSAVLIFLAAKIIRGEAVPRIWVLLGLVAGIGLMVKITMGFLLVCLIAGILLTRARKYLASKWFWIAAAIAAACCVPYIAWQAAHGFPIYEYLLAYKANRTASPSALDLLRYVFVVMNPASALLWLGGLALLFTKRGRVFRPFAWAFLAYFALAAILSVKFYALAGVLLPLLAFGSVCLEKNYRSAPLPSEESPDPAPQQPKGKRVRLARSLKAAYLAAVCLLGAALAPVSMHMLSPMDTAKYNKALGYSRYVQWDTVVSTGIPTFFAGSLGWEDLAQSVSDVYSSLPEEERRNCAIGCSLYGVVGALDYYNVKNGLPRAISADLGCYYWGYGGFDGKCLIFVPAGSFDYWELELDFKTVQIISGSAGVRYSTLSLADRSIYICRDLKIPVEEFWKKMRSAI